jgi:hypothetical protein
MQIDDSDEHSPNAAPSIDERLEPDSNDTVERAEHFAQQPLPSSLTVEGIQIDDSDIQVENASSSISESLASDLYPCSIETTQRACFGNWIFRI